jgi:hypothetical protein
MKRNFLFLGVLVLLMAVVTGTAFGQSNNTEYKINGVSTSEDIGGVEATHRYPDLIFENFNNFTVTVIFEAFTTARSNPNHYVGTIVLRANEKKVLPNTEVSGNMTSIILIVRRLGS